MSELLDEYFNYIENERDFSKNTLDAYIRDINQFTDYLKDKKVDSIIDTNKTIVIKYLMYLQKKGRANSTISRNLASLRSLFQYLLNNNLIDEDPTFNLKSYPTVRKMPDILSDHEVSILLSKPNIDNFKGIRDKVMMQLILTTGMRVSELLDLNIGDLGGNIISVNNGKEKRIININKDTNKLLNIYINRYRYDVDGEGPLFVNLYGHRLSRQGFWKILREYSKKSNISKNITPRMLRYTFAANMLKKGTNIKKVQEILGHSDLSTTEIYLYSESF